MPVGCCRADAGHPRGVGKGESGRALLGDQPERCLQQRLLQIAVMIAALGAALFLAPTHVKGFYMSRWERSLAADAGTQAFTGVNGAKRVRTISTLREWARFSLPRARSAWWGGWHIESAANDVAGGGCFSKFICQIALLRHPPPDR